MTTPDEIYDDEVPDSGDDEPDVEALPRDPGDELGEIAPMDA